MPLDLTDWAAFFTAEAGAAATLAGLLFVGVSLNLSKILGFPFLLMRAFLALLLLLAILVISSLLLVPGQSYETVGFQILLVGIPIWLGGGVIEIRGWRGLSPTQNRITYISNAILLEAATIPYLIAGAMILGNNIDGLDWLSVAIVLSFVKAVVDSWVLLVEINR
jgi:hypothetical protein